MRLSWCLAVMTMFIAAAGRTSAHKPITSPFTFSADVRPIVQVRCGGCHAPGGVAPMSLLTHADALPWAESLRLELMAGHMPPWRVERGADRFRNPGGISARELNVLLTWITGGTPPGDLSLEPSPVSAGAAPPGPPDAVAALPRVTLAPDEQERTVEFPLPASAEPRALRALDLLPGTPSIVREASIEALQDRPGAGIVQDERLLSLWVPGDEVVPLRDAGFVVPAGAKVVVRVRYRKTWEYERREMSDESRVALYFAAAAAKPVKRITLSAGKSVILPRDSRALAIYPDPSLADVGIVVTATAPGGRRDELIAFHPRAGWARRFWLREPLALPAGTRLSIRVIPESPALLPPGFPAPPARPAPSDARVYVNVM
jgi:hypothetical protein